jgi:hypothetical protein
MALFLLNFRLLACASWAGRHSSITSGLFNPSLRIACITNTRNARLANESITVVVNSAQRATGFVRNATNYVCVIRLGLGLSPNPKRTYATPHMLIPELYPSRNLSSFSLVKRLGFAIRTTALDTRRREPWLLGNKIISQRLAYLGMSENLAALFAR